VIATDTFSSNAGHVPVGPCVTRLLAAENINTTIFNIFCGGSCCFEVYFCSLFSLFFSAAALILFIFAAPHRKNILKYETIIR